MTSPADPATAQLAPATRSALTRYRVIAYIVGVMLLLLLFVAMPLKYLGDNSAAMNIIGPAHGWLYVVYLLATFDLFRRVQWTLPRLALMAVAGTIPFLSFYAERKTTHELLNR
ncbi:DUF3817 domain-containing protein [Kribbella sandramycini]|uniref:DUF3817 domain-containing protein n=1 Tax=Kribbella sandramycini TaxID=60450 RepID=A0A7Y4L018_9ACTN|nr:integral membrane protein [Kribbella sandramycini]NOL41812.1 DUF3817 domain-containing protein [Kribbella sandramycini]